MAFHFMKQASGYPPELLQSVTTNKQEWQPGYHRIGGKRNFNVYFQAEHGGETVNLYHSSITLTESLKFSKVSWETVYDFEALWNYIIMSKFKSPYVLWQLFDFQTYISIDDIEFVNCVPSQECHSTLDFQCADGSCIPRQYHCDANYNCADKSDEFQCQKYQVWIYGVVLQDKAAFTLLILRWDYTSAIMSKKFWARTFSQLIASNITLNVVTLV